MSRFLFSLSFVVLFSSHLLGEVILSTGPRSDREVVIASAGVDFAAVWTNFSPTR
jgi:hypothetical protein